MLDLMDEEKNMGFRLDIGTNGILPKETILFINSVNEWIEKHRDIKIENEDDYTQMGEDVRKAKGFCNKLINTKTEGVNIFRRAENQYIDAINPTIDNIEYIWICMKNTMHKNKSEVEKKRKEEKAAAFLKAKEEEDIGKREIETKAIEEQKKADLLTAQRKIDTEKAKELERKRIEEENKIARNAKKIEDVRKEIISNPSLEEDADKEIEALLKENDIVGDIVKKIDSEISNTNSAIKLVAKEELNTRRKAQKLFVEKEALVIAPARPLTKKIPPIKGIVYAKRLTINIVHENLIPDEWFDIVKTLNKKKLNMELKRKGKNFNVPGVEVIEIEDTRTTPY